MANSGKVNQELRRELERRKREVEILSETQSRLQHLLSYSPVVLYSRKPAGDWPTTFVSENVRSILGWEPWEFISEPNFWNDHIHPEDRSMIFTKNFGVFENEYYTHQYRFRRKNGDYIVIHDEFRLVRDFDGQPEEIVGCILAVVDLKEERK
jgi:PAS domain S-box-containing protein